MTIGENVLTHLKAVTAALDLSGTPYRLVRPIGRGGMGAVYQVEDQRLAREVAMKVLDAEADEAEARVIARLEHPGIVPVHDVGRLADGRVYFVMKLVRGERLDAWLANGPPLTAALRVFQQVCDAVAFAHAHGVVHRDLKPQNVMIGAYGEALVMDWGLAHEGAAKAAGTPGFMAPEQVQGSVVDARADVFALGAVLRLLSGPAAIGSISRKALAVNPSDRYPDAAALGADVTAWLNGLPVSAHRETVVERAARWFRKYRVLVLLVVAYLMMRAAVALIAGR